MEKIKATITRLEDHPGKVGGQFIPTIPAGKRFKVDTDIEISEGLLLKGICRLTEDGMFVTRDSGHFNIRHFKVKLSDNAFKEMKKLEIGKTIKR